MAQSYPSYEGQEEGEEAGSGQTPPYYYSGNQTESLTRKQKVAGGFLLFLSAFVLLMWIFQMRDNLSLSQRRSVKDVDKEQPAATCQGEACQAQYEASQKQKDTDKDGLTDYDELKVYGTSPYLEDSDSDGQADKSEIDRGGNPNCPEGVSCIDSYSTPVQTESVSRSDMEALKSIPELDDVISGISSASSSGSQINAQSIEPDNLQSLMSGQATAAQIREAMLRSGANPDMLKDVSDEQLLEVYKQTLNNGRQ